MSQLSFQTDFHSYELQQADLPVEVRKANLALLKRIRSTDTLDVPPGTYHVTATLPAGQELYTQVTVHEGERATAVLRPDLADVSPSENLEVQRYIVGQASASAIAYRGLEQLGAGQAAAALRVFEGNILEGPVALRNAEDLLIPEAAPARGVAKFRCLSGQVRFAQLLQPKTPPTNVALPISPEGDCTLYLMQQPDGRFTMEAHLQNLDADAILRYYEQGLLEQASTTTDATFYEKLLRDKRRDPVAAAVGAYTLLRLGELKHLHDWTRNLSNWFDWLPDGISIWGEHQARTGKHREALQTFLGLPERGLPIFSDGLSYTIDRLRLYTRLEQTELPSESIESAQLLLAQLQRFADEVDFRKPILTFTGLEPHQPDDEPLGEDIDDYDGLEVIPHIG